MNVTDKFFRFKRIDAEKLVKYGFIENDGIFSCSTEIVNGEMRLFIDTDGKNVYARVIDVGTGDEYTLHAVEDSFGEFVGKVRTEFCNILQDIADNCCENEIFKEEQTKRIIRFIRDEYGDELEFLWKDLPDAAIWRRKDNRKWYGVLMSVKREKLGLGEGYIEVIDVRADPADIDRIADNNLYFRGYHMNKKNWLTIPLDGRVETSEIFKKICKSFDLAEKKK